MLANKSMLLCNISFFQQHTTNTSSADILHLCRQPVTVTEMIYIQNYTYFKLQLILSSHHFDQIK